MDSLVGVRALSTVSFASAGVATELEEEPIGVRDEGNRAAMVVQI